MFAKSRKYLSKFLTISLLVIIAGIQLREKGINIPFAHFKKPETSSSLDSRTPDEMTP